MAKTITKDICISFALSSNINLLSKCDIFCFFIRKQCYELFSNNANSSI